MENRGNFCRSSTSTSWPRRRSNAEAMEPDGPAPITTTCRRSASLVCSMTSRYQRPHSIDQTGRRGELQGACFLVDGHLDGLCACDPRAILAVEDQVVDLEPRFPLDEEGLHAQPVTEPCGAHVLYLQAHDRPQVA